jgi:hypothetical protein
VSRENDILTGDARIPCPNCGYVQNCGCDACLEHRNAGEPITEVWVDGEIGILACGYCGFAMYYDMWEELEMDLHWEHIMGREPEKTPQQRLDILNEYRKRGKMPFEKGYKPTALQHWLHYLERKTSWFRHKYIDGAVRKIFKLLGKDYYAWRYKAKYGEANEQTEV